MDFKLGHYRSGSVDSFILVGFPVLLDGLRESIREDSGLHQAGSAERRSAQAE